MKIEVTYALLGKALSLIGTFWLTSLCVSLLSVEDYGIWSTLLASVMLFSVFDFGISNSYRNDLTKLFVKFEKEPLKKLVNELAIINLIFAIILALLIIACEFNYYGVFFALLSSVIFYCNTTNVYLMSTKRSGFIDFIQFCILLSTIIILLIFKAFNSNLELELLLFYFVTINLIVRLSFSYKWIGFVVPTVNKLSLLNALRTVKLKVRMSVGFFLAQLSFAFVILSDRYYIFNFLGSEAAGNYDLFYKVFNLFLVVSLIFIKPVWAKLAEDSSAEKVKKIKVLYNVFLCFLIFFIFIFCFFVNDIVYLWLGKGYELSMVDAFLFGSFFFFLIAIAKSCYILNALNKVDIQWKVFFIYLILKFVILFFILIDPVSLSLSLILSSNGLLFFVFVFLEFYIGRYCKLNGID